MSYQKTQIIKQGALLGVCLVFAAGATAGLIFSIINEVVTAYIVIQGVILLYFFFLVLAYSVGVIKVIRQYKTVKSSGLLEILKTINPYSTHAEMEDAYKLEKDSIYYEDDEIFITNSFLKFGKFLFLIDGILDAQILVHRTNGSIERIELLILYYTGDKITIEYSRSIGFSGLSEMKKQADNLEYAVQFIAKRSKLFRKYDCCRL